MGGIRNDFPKIIQPGNQIFGRGNIEDKKGCLSVYLCQISSSNISHQNTALIAIYREKVMGLFILEPQLGCESGALPALGYLG